MVFRVPDRREAFFWDQKRQVRVACIPSCQPRWQRTIEHNEVARFREIASPALLDLQLSGQDETRVEALECRVGYLKFASGTDKGRQLNSSHHALVNC